MFRRVLLTTPLKRTLLAPRLQLTRAQATVSGLQLDQASLAEIPKTWDGLTTEQKNSISKALDNKMNGDWKSLTLEEKRAAYFISFGPHGARKPADPSESRKVIVGLLLALAAATGISMVTTHYGKETPHTMNKEWQEKSNEYLRAQKADPITGISSPDYKGPGMVQSK